MQTQLRWQYRSMLTIIAALIFTQGFAATDYNNDGITDIAFHRPGSTWNTVPVLFSNSDGSWTATNFPAPSWANQPGVTARPVDFNGNMYIAFFHESGGLWDIPVLHSIGNGSWTAYAFSPLPVFLSEYWARSVILIPGDFNGDGHTDFASPGNNEVMVRFSSLGSSRGCWESQQYPAPSWVSQPGAIAIFDGAYDGDWLVAFECGESFF